jgi:type II secretory pathway pseudopilin PulG
MRRLREESGFGLVEILLVCVVSTIVFGATLAAFTSFYSANRAAQYQSDNVDDARVALDRAARQLRNLANPNAQYATINRATGNDFIFQTSDPAKTWVRYCLDTTSAGASAAHAKLWTSESTNATLPAGMTGACGVAASGVTSRIVSQNVTNVTGGMDRPVFTYACQSGSPVTCPASATEYPKITMVGAQLFIDTDPNDRVREQEVATAVYLRNQNQAPTASVTGPVRLGTYKYMLNASGSSDPEGRTLDFHWYVNTTNTAPPSPFNCVSPPDDQWDGPVFIDDFGSAVAGGTPYTAWLVVCDPGGLSSTSPAINGTVPN